MRISVEKINHIDLFFNTKIRLGSEIMKSIMNMKVLARLIISFFIIAVLTGVLGFIGLSGMNKIKGSMDDIYTNRLSAVQYLSVLQDNLLVSRSELLNIVSSNDGQTIQKSLETVKSITSQDNDIFAKLQSISLSGDEKKLLNDYKSAMEEYRPLRDQVIQLVEQNNIDGAKAALNDASNVRLKAENALSNLIEKNKTVSAEEKTAGDRVISSDYNRVLTLYVIILVIILTLAMLISITFRNALKKITKFTYALGNGDLTANINYKYNDEFVKIINGLNQSITKIKGLINEVITGSEESTSSSQQLTEAVEEIASQIENINESVEEINASIQETTSSIEEVENEITEVDKSKEFLAQKAEESSSISFTFTVPSKIFRFQ